MKSQHTVKVIGSKSYEAIWSEIANSARTETPPEGSVTVADFAKTYGLTNRQADVALRKSVQAGKLETGKFRTITDVGIRVLNYYWRAGE